MAIRVPPGRAGRLWLVRRIDVARRGLDVLDQKRQTLLGEQQRLSATLAEAGEAWERKAREAATWNDRAAAIAGARRVRSASRYLGRPAQVTVEWRNAVGVVLAHTATVEVGESPDFVALGGGSSVALAARAHAEALSAAAACAAARSAYDAVTAELAVTARRLRVIERRWIPQHEAALGRLELTLDQNELEDTIRVRRGLLIGHES